MANDSLTKYRKKSKFTLEIRYPPILQAFDKRGEVLSILHNSFVSKIPHWRISNIEVQLVDTNENPSRIISVDHKTIRVVYEDANSLQEFNDDIKKLLENLYSIYPNELNEIIRIGVRFQSVFAFPKYKSFDEILTKLQSTILNPNNILSVKLTDCQFTLMHDTGNITFGPVKREESWIGINFLLPKKNTPKYGLALDIDSYAQNTKVNDANMLFNLFRTVEDLTLASEIEITNPFVDEV